MVEEPKIDKSVKELIEELENSINVVQQRELATEIHKKVKREAKEKLSKMKSGRGVAVNVAEVLISSLFFICFFMYVYNIIFY